MEFHHLLFNLNLLYIYATSSCPVITLPYIGNRCVHEVLILLLLALMDFFFAEQPVVQ